MRFDKLSSFLLPKLENDLSASLTYHSVHHTRDVMRVVQQLAKSERVSREETEMLLTAALFHDAGFLAGYEDHEERSCQLAAETLPAYGYTEEEIRQVCRLISATRIPQRPTDKLEKILCDADLAYLGTDSYFAKAELLYRELMHAGKVKSREEWLDLQAAFLETHHFHSAVAKRLYTVKKSQNFLLLKAGVHQGEDGPKRRVRTLKDIALVVLGVFCAAFGLKSFLVPAHFFDGGVTGIALIIHTALGFNLSLTTFLLNLPFIIASYFVVSRTFAAKAFGGIALLALFLLLLPEQSVTHDKLLIAFFGGFFIGIGSGLAIRAGAVLDGTEVLALYTLRITSFTIAEIILAINILIFSLAALVENVESAFYSILTYIVASRTISYVVEGIEAHTGVTIISSQSEVLKSRLVNEMHRSITVYKGERGYLPGKAGKATECDIIFAVISRLELRKLKKLVYEADPNAFVFATTINEAAGGILQHQRAH